MRVIRRSWVRWRTKELLWGTNTENFWKQLAFWRGEDSLIWWIWNNFEKRRRQVSETEADPRWQHIRIIRINGTREVDRLRSALR